MKKAILLLATLLSITCFAANEVHQPYAVGSNLYFRVFNAAGQVWRTDTAAFGNWADGQVTNYDVALTGTGGSFYVGSFPNLDDGDYSVVAYLRADGTPAVSDGVISGATMFWKDGAEITISTTLSDLVMPTTTAGKAQR